MAKRIDDFSIRTDKVRVSYLRIHKPEKKLDQMGTVVVDPDTGEPIMQYSTQIIIPKTEKATIDMLVECMKAAAQKTFKGSVPATWRKGLRDGDTDPAALIDQMDESKGRKPELVGSYWINTTAYDKPRCISAIKDEFTNEFKNLSEHEIKSGDWVWAQIRCYGFDKPQNKGVAFGIVGVQKREDGEPLSSGGFNMSAFEDDEELAGSF